MAYLTLTQAATYINDPAWVALSDADKTFYLSRASGRFDLLDLNDGYDGLTERYEDGVKTGTVDSIPYRVALVVVRLALWYSQNPLLYTQPLEVGKKTTTREVADLPVEIQAMVHSLVRLNSALLSFT